MLASIVEKASAEAGVGPTMTEVPADLLGAEELHLRPWSMLVTDKTLIALANKNDVRDKRQTTQTSCLPINPNPMFYLNCSEFTNQAD